MAQCSDTCIPSCQQKRAMSGYQPPPSWFHFRLRFEKIFSQCQKSFSNLKNCFQTYVVPERLGETLYVKTALECTMGAELGLIPASRLVRSRAARFRSVTPKILLIYGYPMDFSKLSGPGPVLWGRCSDACALFCRETRAASHFESPCYSNGITS